MPSKSLVYLEPNAASLQWQCYQCSALSKSNKIITAKAVKTCQSLKKQKSITKNFEQKHGFFALKQANFANTRRRCGGFKKKTKKNLKKIKIFWKNCWQYNFDCGNITMLTHRCWNTRQQEPWQLHNSKDIKYQMLQANFY